MIRFVQACDRDFAAQGLALYRSLEHAMRGGADWTMSWVCMDDDTKARLDRWWLRHTDTRLEIEGDEFFDRLGVLRDVFRGRRDAAGEPTPAWYWTWASQVVHWAMEEWPGDTIVYLDSDCYAFADLRPGLAEVEAAGADVGLVSHRFPPHRAHQEARAHFNVGSLTTFQPTLRARACAAWWAAMVRGRCEVEDPGDAYLGIPPGRAGDQAPLDAFARLAKVHEILDPGIGLAPYNWDAEPMHAGFVDSVPRVGHPTAYGMPSAPAVRLAHFHEWRFNPDGTVARRTGYPIPDGVQAHLVAPYEAAVRAAALELSAVTP